MWRLLAHLALASLLKFLDTAVGLVRLPVRLRKRRVTVSPRLSDLRPYKFSFRPTPPPPPPPPLKTSTPRGGREDVTTVCVKLCDVLSHASVSRGCHRSPAHASVPVHIIGTGTHHRFSSDRAGMQCQPFDVHVHTRSGWISSKRLNFTDDSPKARTGCWPHQQISNHTFGTSWTCKEETINYSGCSKPYYYAVRSPLP